MEWLKTILEKATVNDGVLDVNGVLESVKTELPKHFVAKTDYNTKVEELKTATGTLEKLKNDNEGNEILQQTIKTHETTISNLQKENENMKKTYSLKSALAESGCNDPDYLIFKLGGSDKFTFDKEGKPVDAKEVAESYKESIPYIFPTGEKLHTYNPAGGVGGAGNVNPFTKEHWNMTEQGKLLKSNPEEAKAMAAAAGVNL